MNDRYDQLQPGQIAAALRSFPRRYGAQLARLSPAAHGTESAPAEPDDAAAVALVASTVESMRRRGAGLREIVVLGHVTVDAGVFDDAGAAETSRRTHRGQSAIEIVEQLTAVVNGIAEVVDAASARDWNRAANRSDGRELRAIDVARDAARIGGERLRQLEHLVDSQTGGHQD
jgi:hypothetical protein